MSQIQPLPSFRIEQCPPLTFTGVDHAGPVYVRDGNGARVKSYILLFVCAVTRAVRVELRANLSCYEFLLALRRFIIRNPTVTRLIADNATTFNRAEKEINLLFAREIVGVTGAACSREDRVAVLHGEGTTWQGGFWERVVQIVKRPLRKALGVHSLTFR